MRTITDSTGSEIEVFMKDEVDTQIQSALETYANENPDKSEELGELQKKLEVAQGEVEKFKGKDLNFANLRAQKDAADAKIDALKQEIDTKIGTAKKEILEGVLQDHYSETVSGIAGGDEELKKKIEYHYKRLQDVAGTKEEVAKKLRDAWVLATKQDDPGAMNTAVISSGFVSRPNAGNKQNFSADEKEFAKKLASSGGLKLEDKDFR